MNDGAIHNNIGRFGGGVRIGAAVPAGTPPPAPTLTTSPSMHMAGGEIYLNTAFFGGGVNLEWGLFTMEDGTIRDNTTTGLGNPGTVNETLVMANRGGGGLLAQNRGIFEMTGGTISGNTAAASGGGIVLLAGTTFTMSGGTISGNTAAHNGGGIAAALVAQTVAGAPVAGTVTLNIAGGTISGNTATNGGGVSLTPGNNTVDTGSQLTMTAGTISGNTATNNGGGIWLGGSTSVISLGSQLIMSGGTITKNTATAGNGGGIWLGIGTATTGARLNMTGGTISENRALSTTMPNGNGGGIFTDAYSYFDPLPSYAYANLSITEDVTFSLNTAGGGKWEPPSSSYTFNFPFEDLLTNYDINFIGTNPLARITFELNGGNVLGDPADIIGSIPLSLTIGEAKGIPPAERPGYVLIGWIRDGDDTIILTPEQVAALYVTASTTFTAVWEPVITITYQSGTNGIFPGDVTSITETLISGGYPSQVPTPIAVGNFYFIGWSRNGSAVLLSTAEIEALFIDTDTTFTAQWDLSGGGGIRPPLPPNRPSRQAYLIGTDGSIRPHANITRAEVATIFFRLIDDADRAANWNQTNPYSDVALENWFNNGISTTTQMGIFRGRPDGTFGPNQPITRAEFAAAAMRFVDTAGLLIAEDDLFDDIYRHWANAYINALGANNWVQGPYGQGGAFYPDRLITRAETAAIINRIFNRLPESPADLLPDMKTWPDNANTNAWYYLYLQSASNSYTYEMKSDGIHKRWIGIIPVRNWAALERPDSTPGSIL